VVSTFRSISVAQSDMSKVYLHDREGTYWPIPYSDRRLPVVTLSEINSARRQLLDAGHKRLTQRQVFDALEQQRELVEQAAGKSKKARRDLERARRGLSEAGASNPEPAPVPSEVTASKEELGPIVPFPVEEWS
jgi:putative transposase